MNNGSDVKAGLRVNLGSGPLVVPGWTSIDRSPNVLLDRYRPLKQALHRAGLLDDAHLGQWPREVVRRDMRRPLPFQSESVSAIYSSHALEHVYLSEAAKILRECRRTLVPGGIIRLALPDAEELARNLLVNESVDSGRRFNQQTYAHPVDPPTLKQRLRGLVGSAPHRWQPSESLVRELLVEAGFEDVARHGFRTGKMPDLDVVEHRAESLFMEAVRY